MSKGRFAFAFLAVFVSSIAWASQGSAGERGRYIVVLEDSVEHPGNVAQRHAANRDATITSVYHTALKGYAAAMSPADAAAVASDPAVASIEHDRPGGIAAQTTPTGVKRVFAGANASLFINEENDVAANVDIAILDTGIDSSHPDLNVLTQVNCVGGKCSVGGGDDEHGHGTHVAGIAAAADDTNGVVGIASNARLWAIKVANSMGKGELSEYIAGVDWVSSKAESIEVANSSVRYKVSKSEALDTAMKASVNAGVVHVVAAGNDQDNASNYLPAGHPDVTTVSAIADYDGIPGKKAKPTCEEGGGDDTSYILSNFGATIEVAAPGVCILSTWRNEEFKELSGTSMAAPHVAGAAAILATHSNPNSRKDVEAIRSTIINAGNAEEWEDTSKDGFKEPLLEMSNEGIFYLE